MISINILQNKYITNILFISARVCIYKYNININNLIDYNLIKYIANCHIE
jgi:hypothetical protein